VGVYDVGFPRGTLTSQRDGLSGADEVRGLGGDAVASEGRSTSSSHRSLLGDTVRSHVTDGMPIAENAERIGGVRSRWSSIQREVTVIEGPDAASDRSCRHGSGSCVSSN